MYNAFYRMVNLESTRTYFVQDTNKSIAVRKLLVLEFPIKIFFSERENLCLKRHFLDWPRTKNKNWRYYSHMFDHSVVWNWGISLKCAFNSSQNSFDLIFPVWYFGRFWLFARCRTWVIQISAIVLFVCHKSVIKHWNEPISNISILHCDRNKFTFWD